MKVISHRYSLCQVHSEGSRLRGSSRISGLAQGCQHRSFLVYRLRFGDPNRITRQIAQSSSK